MVFRLTASEERYQADFARDGASCLTIVNVGYDDDTDRAYSIVLGLSPMAGGELEFYFHIVEAEGETGEERPFWSGKDVARFMPRRDRAVVLAILLRETGSLLRRAVPEKVHYVTYDEYPPENALLKHLLVANVFEESGYIVHLADPWHGKRVWWMERRDSQP